MKKLLFLTFIVASTPLIGMEMEIEPPVTQPVTLISKDNQSFTISPDIANLIPTVRSVASIPGEGQYNQRLDLIDGNILKLIIQAIEQFMTADTTKKLLEKDPEFLKKHTPAGVPALVRMSVKPILEGKPKETVDQLIQAADFLGLEWLIDAIKLMQEYKYEPVYSIADLIVLDKLPDIHDNEIVLSYMNIISLVGINLIPQGKQLQRIFLIHNQLRDLPENVFAGLVNLQALNLSHNKLSMLSENAFAGLTHLDFLDLSHNQLKNMLAENAFVGLTNLEDLHLDDNQLSMLPEKIFAGLTHLQRLSLFGNQLNMLPEKVVAGLTNLKDLYLGDNPLDAATKNRIRQALPNVHVRF